MTTRFSQERRTRGHHSPGRVAPFQVLLAKQGGASVSTSTLGTVFPRRLRDRFATPLQKLLIAKADAGRNSIPRCRHPGIPEGETRSHYRCGYPYLDYEKKPK